MHIRKIWTIIVNTSQKRSDLGFRKCYLLYSDPKITEIYLQAVEAKKRNMG